MNEIEKLTVKINKRIREIKSDKDYIEDIEKRQNIFEHTKPFIRKSIKQIDMVLELKTLDWVLRTICEIEYESGGGPR